TRPGISGPQGANPYYRPALDVLYKTEYVLFGFNPHGYHLFNVLLHILNGVMVYALVYFLGAGTSFAAVTAMLFLIHPVQTESVACVAGVSNLVYSWAVLVSLLLYIIARSKSAGKYSVLVYALSLIYFLIALFSKEQAIVLPFLIVLFDLCF